MKFSLTLLSLVTLACAATVPHSFSPVHVNKVIDAKSHMVGNDTGVVGKRSAQTPGMLASFAPLLISRSTVSV
ncbi:hypothetical protein C8J56DRAFT_1061181 [Mycena floridula]|nr:hypothetical protein C8J56DRAFT_1061181 [Mycena floridula]